VADRLINRPWTKWSFDETLAAIRLAGYTTIGLLTPTGRDPFIGDDATPAYLDSLTAAIAGSGPRAVMGSLRSRHDIPLADTVASLRTQIDHAAFLGLEWVITFGTDRADQVDQYLASMAQAAAYGQEKKVEVVDHHIGLRCRAALGAVRYRRRRLQRRLHNPEARRVQRPDHGRVLRRGRHCRSDCRERTREPRVPRTSTRRDLTRDPDLAGARTHARHVAGMLSR